MMSGAQEKGTKVSPSLTPVLLVGNNYQDPLGLGQFALLLQPSMNPLPSVFRNLLGLVPLRIDELKRRHDRSLPKRPDMIAIGDSQL